MAKAGVIQIDIDAGTAKFLGDMDAANVKLRDFGSGAQQSGIHLVSSMQASSAAIRLMENPLGNNIRAVERFISLLPGMGKLLQAAFPVVGALAFADILIKMGTEALNFYQKVSQAPERIAGAFRAISAPMQLTNDELKVSNDRLSIEIAKLEGRPQNTLALALDEARVAADKLADSLDKDLDRIGKVLKEETHGFWAGLVRGQAGTEDIRKELVGETGAGGFRATLAGAKGDPKQSAALLDAEISKLTALLDPVMMRQKFGDRLDLTPRIELLNEAIRNLSSERGNIDLTTKNTAMTGKKDSLEAAKENAKTEEQALKAGYDQMLDDLESSESLMAADKLEFRENELREITQYGNKYKELQHELNNEISKLSQEDFAASKAARDKDEKSEEEYQQRMSEQKLLWAKWTYEGLAQSNKFYSVSGKKPTEPAPGSPQAEMTRDMLTGTPMGNRFIVQQAGYKSIQERQGLTGQDENTLAMMQKGGFTLGQELALREQILQSKIALNAEQGKDNSQNEVALANLKVQQTLLQWKSQGMGSAYGDLANSAMQIPGQLGGALASGIFGGGKKGEDVGTQIQKALKNVGKEMLGEVFTKLIESVIANTISTNANTIWTAMVALVPKPFGFAAGGRPSPGVPYIVGEHGPELRVDDAPGTIIPHGRFSSAAEVNRSFDNFSGSASGRSGSANGFPVGDMHFHAHGITDPDEFVDQVQRKIADRMKSYSPIFSPYNS